MRFPVLTPTEAPLWFSQAFEDAERVFWGSYWLSDERPFPLSEGTFFDSEAAAYRFLSPCASAMGFKPVPLTMETAILKAKRDKRDWVVIRDAQGNELKRWSVLA